MGRKWIPIKNDVMFKSLFAKNPDILASFLSSIMKTEINENEITVKNPELTPFSIDGKLSRLDILLQKGNERINIEMQVAGRRDYRDRALFYWAKMCADSLDEGEAYRSLDCCIGINVLGFNLLPGEKYHSIYLPMEKDRHDILTDKMIIHFLELRKLGDNIDGCNMEELWLKLIKAENKEDYEMLRYQNVPIINKSIEKVNILNGDDKIKEIARIREDAERDYNSLMDNAREEGREEGRAEIIAKMMSKGITEEQIKELLE